MIAPISLDAASHRAELTAEEHERFTLCEVHGHDLADNDDVVAAVVDVPRPALKRGSVPGQHRDVAVQRPFRFRVDDFAGKVPGRIDLFEGQDVDGERGTFKVPSGARGPGHCDLDQRRVDGYRGEGVDHGAVRNAVVRPGGDHRDTGGERAEHLAQFSLFHASHDVLHHRLLLPAVVRTGLGYPRSPPPTGSTTPVM